jgi:hypothetical protein
MSIRKDINVDAILLVAFFSTGLALIFAAWAAWGWMFGGVERFAR